MKPCIACAHCVGRDEFAWCHSPKAPMSVITGAPEKSVAVLYREDDAHCGLEGRWFEPRSAEANRLMANFSDGQAPRRRSWQPPT